MKILLLQQQEKIRMEHYLIIKKTCKSLSKNSIISNRSDLCFSRIMYYFYEQMGIRIVYNINIKTKKCRKIIFLY